MISFFIKHNKYHYLNLINLYSILLFNYNNYNNYIYSNYLNFDNKYLFYIYQLFFIRLKYIKFRKIIWFYSMEQSIKVINNFFAILWKLILIRAKRKAGSRKLPYTSIKVYKLFLQRLIASKSKQLLYINNIKSNKIIQRVVYFIFIIIINFKASLFSKYNI